MESWSTSSAAAMRTTSGLSGRVCSILIQGAKDMGQKVASLLVFSFQGRGGEVPGGQRERRWWGSVTVGRCTGCGVFLWIRVARLRGGIHGGWHADATRA